MTPRPSRACTREEGWKVTGTEGEAGFAQSVIAVLDRSDIDAPLRRAEDLTDAAPLLATTRLLPAPRPRVLSVKVILGIVLVIFVMAYPFWLTPIDSTPVRNFSKAAAWNGGRRTADPTV